MTTPSKKQILPKQRQTRRPVARPRLVARSRAAEPESVYKSFFDNAVEGIFQTSPDGRYLEANAMLARIYGYSSTAELISAFTDIGNQLYVDQNRRAEFRAILQAEDAVFGFESEVRRKDGSTIWISENARAVRAPDGRLLGYEGTVLDITARKAAEDELARTRARERASSAKIQQGLLLGRPPRNISWLSFGALTIASQDVDGDFYDFHAHSDRCVDVLLGDVMGKGIVAALLGAAIKSRFLRAVAQMIYASPDGELPEPASVIEVIHHDFTPQFIALEFFSTLCYLRFDRDARLATFVDCGHTKTVRWSKATRQCSTLECDCLPLGFSLQEVYTQGSVPLETGDVFVCYSDGVTEAIDASGEVFGGERLMSIFESCDGAAPEEIVERVKCAVIEHVGEKGLADDMTIIAIRVEQ